MNSLSKYFSISMFLIFFCESIFAETRTWTSIDGRKIEAAYVSSDASSVTVMKQGRKVTIKLEQLSEEDRKYIENQVANLAAKEKNKPTVDLSKYGDYAKFIKGEWVKSDEKDLLYQIYCPTKIYEDTKLPLVIFLHGAGERGSDNVKQLDYRPKEFTTAKNQEQRPCVVIAPQCGLDQYWTDEQLTEKVNNLVKKLAKNLPVDDSRIYISGFSMGGYGTWEALSKGSKIYAAGLPISGGADPAIARSIKKIPIWNFHGDNDTSVSVKNSREIVEALKKIKAKITYTEYPGEGHGISHKVLKDTKVMEWLFEQKKD
jgi:predicted peptidase